jgi:hypothetical protein
MPICRKPGLRHGMLLPKDKAGKVDYWLQSFQDFWLKLNKQKLTIPFSVIQHLLTAPLKMLGVTYSKRYLPSLLSTMRPLALVISPIRRAD